jgi:ribonuclease HII
MRKPKARIPIPGAQTKFIVGIDEVGRGPLAGPVTVAAVLVPASFPFRVPFGRTDLRDSKRLSAEKRRAWFTFLKSVPSMRYAVVSMSPRSIDRMNISAAANEAATRAFGTLAARYGRAVRNSTVLLDAGLRIDRGILIKYGLLGRTQSLVKGDERVQAIAFASIIAKVTRDRFMELLDTRYPSYGFAAHKGYGTRAHIRAIRVHGPCPIHRLTFLRKVGRMKK